MKKIGIYLNFQGTCEEALLFYKNCLDGEIIAIQKFEHAPMPVPDHYKNKVLHAQFKAEGIEFMASDTMPEQGLTSGNQVSLSLDFTDPDEQKTVYTKFLENGIETMPLQDTFWGATFGMITDKYGINWMFNYDKPAN